jgi:tetratricopeptide (TPR) repeat protein
VQERFRSTKLVLHLLDIALQGQRNGTLEDLVRKHPRAARWLMRRHWRVVLGAAGDALPARPAPQVASLLLRWLVTQLRPDAEPSFEGLSEEAWIRQPVWRPMLAMACQVGLVSVPDYPKQYRRGSGEPPLDNLCGLWGIDTSTLYRVLEKARRAMAFMLVDPKPDAARRLSLRAWVTRELNDSHTGAGSTQLLAWHLRQCSNSWVEKDPAALVWHRAQAGDVLGFTRVLLNKAAVLVDEPEAEVLADALVMTELPARIQVDLWLARAAFARTRNLSVKELDACESALALSKRAEDPLLQGIAHCALGKYYEPRDADRAFAYYQQSADFLRDLDPEGDDTETVGHFVSTFSRLAWLYLLRNDPRSKALLDKAEALISMHRVRDDLRGVLEQVWGEYFRRIGDLTRSLEHRYRALNIFEHLGDKRSSLATHLNLISVHREMGNHDRSIRCARMIFDAANVGLVEPALLISAHLNLGLTYLSIGEVDQAIEQHTAALNQSRQSDLRLHAFRARYNLAEAYYTRFRAGGRPEDERAGDVYVAEVLAATGAESIRNVVEAARDLKEKILSKADATELNQLIPDEDAVHYDELAEIHRQREILAVPAGPERHASAHLSIARAYAAIAAKEREAALALIQRAGLQDRFSADLAGLRQTFERGLTREQKLVATWKQQAADLLNDSRRAALVTYLSSNGAVNKSRYAELGAVSPATASKHLAMLTERGLLVQHGKGPSTRYALPE